MANSHETLTSLFTDIANAIREKTKSVDPIIADNFPVAIEAIKAGEGQYVWKKYEAEEAQVTNPTFSFVTPRTDAVWGITSTSFDPYKVDESFFDGFTFDQKYNSKTTTQQLVYIDGKLYGTGGIFESNYPRISYDPKTASFTSEHTLSASVRTLSNGKFVGQKNYAKVKGFLGYVSVDDENSYPNGGLLDGCWYDKVTDYTGSYTITPSTVNQTIPINALLNEILTIAGDVDLIASNIRSGKNIFGVNGTMIEGVSGIAYGTITPTANTLTLTVEHNLGTIPKDFIIISRNPSLTTKKIDTLHMAHIINNSTKVGSWYSGMYQLLGTEANVTFSSNNISTTITSWNTNYFVQGCEYLWMARA